LGDIQQTNRSANKHHTVLKQPPWDKAAKTSGQTDLPPGKKQKKLNNKQGTEKEHEAEGAGCCKHT
jgi:hypothetical protein